MKRKQGLSWILFFLTQFVLPYSAAAKGFTLEVGTMATENLPAKDSGTQSYVGFGFSARAFYEIERFAFGVATRAVLTTSAVIHVSPESSSAPEINGDFSRRQAALGGVLRFFTSKEKQDGRQYVEVGVSSVQYDLVNAGQILDFQLDPGEERFLVRGYAVSLGGGVQFKNSPFFFQLNYEYEKYDWLQIVGINRMLNYVIIEPQIASTLTIHTLLLTVGWSNLF